MVVYLHEKYIMFKGKHYFAVSSSQPVLVGAQSSGRRLFGSGGAPTATGEVAVDNGRRLLDAATSGDSADSSPTYGPALKASVGGLRDCVGWDCGRGLRKPRFLGALFCGEVLIYDASSFPG